MRGCKIWPRAIHIPLKNKPCARGDKSRGETESVRERCHNPNFTSVESPVNSPCPCVYLEHFPRLPWRLCRRGAAMTRRSTLKIPHIYKKGIDLRFCSTSPLPAPAPLVQPSRQSPSKDSLCEGKLNQRRKPENLGVVTLVLRPSYRHCNSHKHIGELLPRLFA